MQQWYFTRQGKRFGPFSLEQLQELARTQRLQRDDLVSYVGASTWTQAGSVANLFVPPLPPPLPAPTTEPGQKSFLSRVLSLPKPILFGLCGGLGGLLGALFFGELLWLLLSPAGVRPAEPRVRMAIPAGVRVYLGGKNRFLVRVAREGFTGPILIEPEELPKGVLLKSVSIPEDGSEAELEVQVVDALPKGAHYVKIWARAKDHANISPDYSSLEVIVEPVPGELRLSIPPVLSLYQGGTTRFGVRVARQRCQGAVGLHFEGLPDGVAIADAIVPENQSEAQLELTARSAAAVGTHHATLRGTLRDDRQEVSAQVECNLQVRQKPAQQADIVFVLDLTASMQFAIDGVKEGIQNFVTKLEGQNIDARIALVGFRDIQEDKERPFVMKVKGEAFTTDYKAFREEVQKLIAKGGGDIPESSLQALALAAGQPFRPDASRVVVLITDAVPKFHANEKPSTIKETVEEMNKGHIDQLHMLVRNLDYQSSYFSFRSSFKGSFFDLENNTSADALGNLLPQLSKDISLLTVAAQAVAPTGSTTPPPLPIESAALLPPVVPEPVLLAVQSTQAYTRGDRYALLFAIAVWTMCVAGGISLLILAGQRYYASATLLGVREGSWALLGGILAGLIGGAAGQWIFQGTAGAASLELVSRLLGWGLLGALIGGGMAFFIPNLRWQRGLAGGLIGGLLGALAFYLVSQVSGSLLGRLIGAGILGFFIGLMVALAELAFRRYWLEIAFGPREIRTVTLGDSPVPIGSDERRVAVMVPGGPPIALRYRIDNERILCQDIVAEKTTEVVPGDRRLLGKVAITVCSAGQRRGAGTTLELANGQKFRLVDGLPLTPQDLPGLEPQGNDGLVALVSGRPNDPTVLLLRNRSKQAWVIRQADGSEQRIEPGRGLELSYRGAVAFGTLRGRFRPDR